METPAVAQTHSHKHPRFLACVSLSDCLHLMLKVTIKNPHGPFNPGGNGLNYHVSRSYIGEWRVLHWETIEKSGAVSPWLCQDTRLQECNMQYLFITHVLQVQRKYWKKKYTMGSPPVPNTVNLLHSLIHTSWTGAFSTIACSKIAK